MPTLLIDNFNARSDGSIIGQGAWARGYGSDDFVVQSAVAVEGKALKIIGVGGENILKTVGLSSCGTGTLFFYLRAENNNTSATINLLDADYPGYTHQVGIIGFDGSGNIFYYNGLTPTTFGTQNAGQWYCLGIQWDNATSKLRYTCDGGVTWTSWVNPVLGTTVSDITALILDVRVGTFYLDYLGETPFSVAPAPNFLPFF